MYVCIYIYIYRDMCICVSFSLSLLYICSSRAMTQLSCGIYVHTCFQCLGIQVLNMRFRRVAFPMSVSCSSGAVGFPEQACPLFWVGNFPLAFSPSGARAEILEQCLR